MIQLKGVGILSLRLYSTVVNSFFPFVAIRHRRHSGRDQDDSADLVILCLGPLFDLLSDHVCKIRKTLALQQPRD
jgi:hypothetical protein